LHFISANRVPQTANLAHYTTYKERELLPTANILFNHVIKDLQPNVNDSLYKKYAAKRYMKVCFARLVFDLRTDARAV